MHKIFLSISLAALSLGGSAQSYTLSQKTTTLSGFSNEQYFEAQIKLTNNAAADSDFSWVKIEESYASAWLYSFCDPANCYDNSTGIPVTKDFVVRPGKHGILKFDIYPTNVAGSGKLKVGVFRKSAPTLVDTITYTISVWNPLSIKAAQQPELTLYPNPANNELRLNYDSKSVYNVELMNLIGNKVKTYSRLQGDERLDIGDLPSGVYILRLYDNGKVVSRRFTKN